MYEHKKSVNFLNFRKKQYVDFRIKELFGKDGDSSKNDDNDENLDDFETEESKEKVCWPKDPNWGAKAVIEKTEKSVTIDLNILAELKGKAEEECE